MRKLLAILLIAVSFQYAFSQQVDIPVFVGAVEGVKEYKLPNGLQILLVPDPAISNVIVSIVYHVGSRHEGYGETGMAHLLEHMLFRPSKKFNSIKETIANKGANANGSTWYDRTDYHEILPAADSNLNWALDMESDRMVNSLMLDSDLQKEFSVVRNEFEDGENYPESILNERVLSTMYLWHNYGKSTIGSKEDIERVPLNNLVAFYQKYYRPDNATLLIGGKFDEQNTLTMIGKYFGAIARSNRVIQQPYTVEPPQDGQRYVELKRNGDLQYIGIGYHTPSFADPDCAANSAIVHILSNDPSGIFYKALVETRLATKVSGATYELHDPGFSYYSCSVPMDKNLDSAKNAFIRSANFLSASEINEKDLDRAKNSILKYLENTQNNTIDFVQAETEYIGAGDWRLFYIHRDQIKNLKLEDVQRVLGKYYRQSNMTVGVFIPDKNAEKERVTILETPDLNPMVKNYKGNSTQAQTESFAATISNIKQNTQYGRLSNGMKFALLKKPAKGDKIYAKLILKYGDEKSLTDKRMISTVTARLMKTRTTTKSKQEINELLDKIRTSVNVWATGGAVHVFINTNKENLYAALDLLTDFLLHAEFDQAEFEKTKIEIKSELDASQSDPQQIAFNSVEKKTELYPKGHPFYPSNFAESSEDLEKVSIQDVKSFYERFYGVNNGVISVVGNIDQAALKTYLEKNLGKYSSNQAYSKIITRYFDVKGGTQKIQVVDKSNACGIGKIEIPLKESDPEFPQLDMANQMLGGGTFMSSLITKRLRETEGMSYGAASWVEPDYQYAASSWMVYTIFNPIYEGRLDSALKQVIETTLKNGFKEDAFQKSLISWAADRQTTLSQDDNTAYMLASYLDEGKTLDFYMDYEERVKKLTLGQVNAVARKYLTPDKITLVYAGSFDKK